ncbi:hypothetical protein ACFYZ5_46410 [Streptomyces chartreusis]|uniref:hypothetical protein n=1 Tax=Streptomyces chartreusis TaxID=1969 RepID=UPI0036A9E696
MQAFDSQEAQDIWVAQQIQKNLDEDELKHDDILIVLPDVYRAKSRAPRLMRTLREHGIPSHLVGVSTSADTVFVPSLEWAPILFSETGAARVIPLPIGIISLPQVLTAAPGVEPFIAPRTRCESAINHRRGGASQTWNERSMCMT